MSDPSSSYTYSRDSTPSVDSGVYFFFFLVPGVLFLAFIIGVACCLHRRRNAETGRDDGFCSFRWLPCCGKDEPAGVVGPQVYVYEAEPAVVVRPIPLRPAQPATMQGQPLSYNHQNPQNYGGAYGYGPNGGGGGDVSLSSQGPPPFGGGAGGGGGANAPYGASNSVPSYVQNTGRHDYQNTTVSSVNHYGNNNSCSRPHAAAAAYGYGSHTNNNGAAANAPFGGGASTASGNTNNANSSHCAAAPAATDTNTTGLTTTQNHLPSAGPALAAGPAAATSAAVSHPPSSSVAAEAATPSPAAYAYSPQAMGPSPPQQPPSSANNIPLSPLPYTYTTPT